VADGNLQLSRNSIGCSYVIRAYDQYKDNIDTLCALIYSEFRVKVQPKFDKKENYWFIKFGNKVIFRYLNKIFDIPIGDKSSIIRMPKIIKDSHISYQIAFVSGFMMFDGGVHFNQARFSLGTKSKMLYEDIKQVLESLKLCPDYTNEKITKSKDVFSIEIWKKDVLKKLLKKFIEPNTTKWKQLNYLINGLDRKLESLDEGISLLSSIYPRVRKSAITYVDIIKAINKMGHTTTKELSEVFNKHPKVIFNYLKRLEEFRILESKIKKDKFPNKVYKIWSINSRLLKTGGGEKR
jgi:hypothetical protein